ncbi:FMN-linked oxidoreductase [Aspergillus sclerotiicarbonarius CBS 121057]|uniref:FMN-linked oxidoreductase n=1 Tax=Aspergillus sclerotiicarbonarius (strain CBS 121057 / IBT 28362) TaxID=1448318 RepID=A0A319FLK4_ASPSB|nr:FMN-linked oxidoreductase [Aspergillus sclerotiicarbonarius CBS 121057]
MATLTSPLRVGNLDLKHRVVLAPLTRYRADDQHVPIDIMRDYYAQRASVPGTLLITEGTFISARAGGMNNVPGIWNDAQISQWRTITDAVHERGSYILCQLWALGRAASPEVLSRTNDHVISSGNIPISESSPTPKALDEQEIAEWIQDYARAAQNAVAAGFDGVEIHGANGYLVDQFLQDTANNRSDRWGGSVENRSRFGLEVAKAVSQAIGAERTGYRVSPWSTFQGMRMDNFQNQFTNLIQGLGQLNLAYLHFVEPRISGGQTVEDSIEQNDQFLFDAFGNSGAIILAGGLTAQSATEKLRSHPTRDIAFAFGRHFLANPDLPFRIANDIPFNQYNRATFYRPKDPVGYVDYPFSAEFAAKT